MGQARMAKPDSNLIVPGSPHALWGKLCGYVPSRYVIVVISALANAVEYTLRANLSITIVAMVKQPSSNLSDVTTPANSPEKEGEFEWSPTIQGVILGSFYYGYILTHLVGGQLAQLMGAKRLIACSLFTSSLLTLLTPVAAYYNVVAVIILRIITGIAQGVMTPAVYTMFSSWIPEHERSMALAVIVVGGNIGALVTMPLSGWLCKLGSWPSVFYVLGGCGSVCCVAWMYFVYDSPEEHPRIDERELNYIVENLQTCSPRRGVKVPWARILLSRSVWATALAKFAGSWGYYMLMTKLPAYLASVMNFPIETNGSVNALVYVAMSFALTGAGYLSDLIEKRQLMSKCASRKLFETVALIGPAVSMALIPTSGDNKQLVIGLLVIGMTLYGFYGGGDNPIVVDIAPDFSGSVYGLTCAIGSIPGFVAPVFVGFLLDLDPGNVMMWDYVFYATALIYVVGALVFVLFVSAKPQPWGLAAQADDESQSRLAVDSRQSVCK